MEFIKYAIEKTFLHFPRGNDVNWAKYINFESDLVASLLFFTNYIFHLSLFLDFWNEDEEL